MTFCHPANSIKAMNDQHLKLKLQCNDKICTQTTFWPIYVPEGTQQKTAVCLMTAQEQVHTEAHSNTSMLNQILFFTSI